MTHLDHILCFVPDLPVRRIVDIGAGRGAFLIDVARRGYDARGIEVNSSNVAEAKRRAAEAGVIIHIQEGVGEKLPYDSATFQFANVAEVLEHVNDPEQVLAEISRILSPDGCAYVSIPNRYGFRDPHFHLPFINWMPRAWAEWILSLLHRHKNYGHAASGHQRLSDMHYRTAAGFRRMCSRHGLVFADSRESRLTSHGLATFIPAYRLYAFFFIPTFHGYVTVRKS